MGCLVDLVVLLWPADNSQEQQIRTICMQKVEMTKGSEKLQKNQKAGVGAISRR